MGNTSSGQGEKRSWTQQEVRHPHRLLPELISKQRLRLTENGAIIHNGGTISIRKQLQTRQFEGKNEGKYDGKYAPIDRGFYGSEPDLRITEQKEEQSSLEAQNKYKISRSRKKYKAPPAPHHVQAESSSPDSYQHWEKNKLTEGQQPRRLRLFRTRAETKRRIAEENLSSLPPIGTLHRSLSTPHIETSSSDVNGIGLQMNSLQIVDPLQQHVGSTGDLQHRMNRNEKDTKQYKPKILSSIGRDPKSVDSGKIPWETAPPPKPSAPVKTFYFGMNAEGDINDSVLIEKFAEKIQHISQVNTSKAQISTSSSESLVDLAIDEGGRGICVQLRATLPRKQLDIPRFSPTTAWRLLSALESPLPSEDDDLVPMEDRIPAPPLPLHIPSHMDKSADSGISGDASPQHHDSTHNSQAAWTPQQDLEETSSEGGLDSIPVSPESLTTAKFSPRFSLSLPRDNRLKLYAHTEKVEIPQPTSLHSFKKLKRSMSGVLGKGNFLREENTDVSDSQQQLLDNNWVLSRSVPNSLNTTHVSLPKWSEMNSPLIDQEPEIQEPSLSKQSSFLHLANGGHIMYLPSYTTPSLFLREKSVGALAMSKSCEDLSYETANQVSDSAVRTMDLSKGNSGRKFTFQSTIRQLERKRIAEKLSKQAEHREKERHSEMEAMRRVEEEFQRKREREKADIRQQLRLYSIKQSERNELDLIEPPPQATQVLSEYRQPHRDYREYRPQRGTYTEPDSISLGESSRKRETVHPEVVYKIPKSTQVYITSRQNNSHFSDNYRKDFAQGALPHSLASSDSEVSQSNSRLVQSRLIIPSEPGTDKFTKNTEEDKQEFSSLQFMDRKLSAETIPSLYINEDLDKPEAQSIPKENDKNIEEKKSTPNLVPCLSLGLIQPFVRGKSYRPVSYNPSSNPVAQFAT